MIRAVWYCELRKSWIDVCPGCWIGRFVFVMLVAAPFTWLCWEWITRG